jgi:signal transduction histidine kinase
MSDPAIYPASGGPAGAAPAGSPGSGWKRRSLRTRVALLFVAAVAVTALAMTLSAYFITKTAQENDAVNKAVAQTRFNVFLADSLLPPAPVSDDYTDLLKAYAIRGDFSTLVIAGGETFLSSPQVSADLITPELAARVAQDRIAYQEVTTTQGSALVVGGLARQGGPSLYFFYPQSDRLAQLATLRNVLIGAGVVLALIAALAGYWVARELLRPVGRASRAAVAMARGDLDVRLREGRDEFGILGSSFNRMAENLQAEMTALEAGQARERRFVADVAHELRTPVAALVGEASLLRDRVKADRSAPAEAVRLTGLVDKDIARLRQLVDDLLEIGRLDARAVEAVLEPVDLAAFAGQLIRAHGWAEGAGVTACGEAVFAETDKRLLERILVNLIQNGLAHGAPPVTIEVEADPVRLVVCDSGPGVPPEHLPHIFDRFYKADPSRSTAGGSGLGLAIARENAHLLGGELVAENLRERGVCFTLTLPSAG